MRAQPIHSHKPQLKDKYGAVTSNNRSIKAAGGGPERNFWIFVDQLTHDVQSPPGPLFNIHKFNLGIIS